MKAIVLGAAGRMGSRIIGLLQELSQESDSITLGAAVEKKGHPAVGTDANPAAKGTSFSVRITDDLTSVMDRGDVVIDFTVPEVTLAGLDQVVQKGKPIVIGTTGFKPDEQERIRKASARVPCVFSPNMSVGVNVLFKVARDLARLLGREYDIEVIEAHHRFKKDAPSGTALKLAELLAEARGDALEDVATWSRKGQIGERSASEIGVQVIRAGDIVGEHTVIFGGMGERLEVTHRAHSRDNFARGAILAARWVVGQPPGLYDMGHVLGLSS